MARCAEAARRQPAGDADRRGRAGKTRLAIQIAAQLATEFGDGVWYVDLAPITDPDVVPVAVARALGLPDQPGRSTMDTVMRFVSDRQMLMLLDNCEHLLDASGQMVVALLNACRSGIDHDPRSGNTTFRTAAKQWLARRRVASAVVA